jgi:hypothetical protein
MSFKLPQGLVFMRQETGPLLMRSHGCYASLSSCVNSGDISSMGLGSVVITEAENKLVRFANVFHETTGQHDHIEIDDTENE